MPARAAGPHGDAMTTYSWALTPLGELGTTLCEGHSPNLDHAWLLALRGARDLLVSGHANDVAILVNGEMVAGYAPPRTPPRAHEQATIVADLAEMLQLATADFAAAALS